MPPAFGKICPLKFSAELFPLVAGSCAEELLPAHFEFILRFFASAGAFTRRFLRTGILGWKECLGSFPVHPEIDRFRRFVGGHSALSLMPWKNIQPEN